MMQWKTLFQKELLENWRNYKWIWVPIAFIALMVVDPIVNYYLPDILDALGGLPEGAVFELPEPTVNDAIMMIFGQLGTLGILLIVLISMGTISEERKSGVAEIVLTKPVSYANYVTAKWASMLLLVLSSFLIGFIVTIYYIQLLYGSVSFSTVAQVFLFYSIYLMFIVTLVILFNAMFRSQGIVAFISLALIIAMHGITTLLSHKLTYSPGAIMNHLVVFLETAEVPSELIGTSILTLGLSILLLFLAVIMMRKRAN